ncbi:Lrp/AsnC family transcriptional regulator [Streptomyces sp. SID3343]|uniref:AsnC family transcriptional regulator n=1 Tax=Streptomyces sp. SID3343 TaxID=2690260 RepID=UPI00136DA00D|nr:AsnC family transcriptional regulator [Streptomyces sp. SID3343]
MQLDRTDLDLVHALQEDGRLTYEALAGRVGLSRAAARARVQRLLDAGLVRIVGVVHPLVLGRTTMAHMAIGVDGPAAPVARAVAGLPESVFVTMTAGRAPVVAELRTDSFASLAAAVAEVGRLPGVRAVDVAPYTRVVKDPYTPADEPDPLDLDRIDRVILEALQPDGRMPFAELAQRIGLSPGATRARTLRLLDAGVFRVVALVRPGMLGLGQLTGFALRLTDPAAAAGPGGTVERIAAHDRVQFVAACVGRADLVGTVGGESTDDVLAALEELRALPGVHDVETWLHLDMVKERYDTHLLNGA